MTWEIYDELIDGIPEEIQVKDYVLGINWSCLEAECGSGVAYTARGGALRGGKRDLRGQPLKKAAALAKSWNFEDATIGIAALNAWYSQKNTIDKIPGIKVKYSSGRKKMDDVDPFEALRPEIEAAQGAHVVVVGHFPHVEDISEYAKLTVLERNCRNDCDTPDPACEYVMRDADYAFITGVTLINKTAPRLLELSKNAKTILVGPSVIPSLVLFENGADIIAGRVVLDPEKAKFSCATRESFGDALESFIALV